MTDKLILDTDSVYAFRALYPGDITECVDTTHLSFGAFYKNEAAALISVRIRNREIYLDWMYTLPKFRRQGVMSELLDYVVACGQFGMGPNVFHAICTMDEVGFFLESRGFFFIGTAEGMECTSTLKNLKELNSKKTSSSRRLSELGDRELKILNNQLFNAGEAASGVRLPIRPEAYSEYSRACVTDHGASAVILFNQTDENIMDIAYAYKVKGAEIPFMVMIIESVKEIKSAFSEDMRVRTVALNTVSEKLFTEMFTAVDKTPVYHGEMLLY